MAINYNDVISRWLDIVLGRTDERPLRARRMFTSGDSIYSYGTHFEMARIIRDGKGKPATVLLNGDRFSVTTSKHQSQVRSHVARCGLPSVIIPFTALNSAGIDRDSVEIIDVLPDRNTVTHHETTTMPEGAAWHTYDVDDYVDYSDEQLAAIVARKSAECAEEWERKKGYAAAEEPHSTPDGRTYSVWADWLQRNPEPKTITVDDLSIYDRRRWAKIGEEAILHFGRRQESWRRVPITVTPQEDGSTLYTWDIHRHWLGESLVRAKVRWTKFIACKTCKTTGNNPEIAEADQSRDNAWGRCTDCRGRGRHVRNGSRTAYFLSGFDHQETTPLYFFCELPKKAKPATVAEAYEALKPEAVKLAETIDRPIVRQGDIFAIALASVDKRSLRRQGARFEKRGNLLNTNHEATEVAYLPDGTTLARGVLYHNPGGRDPDHARRRLTEGWNVVIKNTVPLAA